MAQRSPRKLPAGSQALLAVGEGEPLRGGRRLVDDWASGVKRLDHPGAARFGGLVGEQWIAVAGLDIDCDDATLGRSHRLDVHPDWRGQGVGRMLAAIEVRVATRLTRLVRGTEPPCLRASLNNWGTAGCLATRSVATRNG
jgi:GNAT superfamily N-acetyltransferase